jgi:hypothetical protein
MRSEGEDGGEWGDVGGSGHDPIFYYSSHHIYSDYPIYFCSLFRILYHLNARDQIVPFYPKVIGKGLTHRLPSST